jgi:hypothetical protein
MKCIREVKLSFNVTLTMEEAESLLIFAETAVTADEEKMNMDHLKSFQRLLRSNLYEEDLL